MKITKYLYVADKLDFERELRFTIQHLDFDNLETYLTEDDIIKLRNHLNNIIDNNN